MGIFRPITKSNEILQQEDADRCIFDVAVTCVPNPIETEGEGNFAINGAAAATNICDNPRWYKVILIKAYRPMLTDPTQFKWQTIRSTGEEVDDENTPGSKTIDLSSTALIAGLISGETIKITFTIKCHDCKGNKSVTIDVVVS